MNIATPDYSFSLMLSCCVNTFSGIFFPIFLPVMLKNLSSCNVVIAQICHSLYCQNCKNLLEKTKVTKNVTFWAYDPLFLDILVISAPYLFQTNALYRAKCITHKAYPTMYKNSSPFVIQCYSLQWHLQTNNVYSPSQAFAFLLCKLWLGKLHP